MPAHIRNPFEMAVEQVSFALSDLGRALPGRKHRVAAPPAPAVVRKIGVGDLREALREGAADLGVVREDVVFAALIYPIAGLLLAGLLVDHHLLPLIFPLVSGFALLGPVAAVGVYEISRRHEQGLPVTWADEVGVLRSPSIGAILGMGVILLVIFLAWLAAAWGVYMATLGPAPPASVLGFAHDVLMTPAGWAMVVIGCGVGSLFAALTLAITVVSFPLLLDRGGGVGRAVATSVRATRANPGPIALWGLIVGAALVAGSIPALFGLIFVIPLLGHATWRLYRKLVA